MTYIVITADRLNKLQHYGPFDGVDEAREWAARNGGSVVPLYPR